MKSFKEIMEESKRIDEEMESLMQSIGYESLDGVEETPLDFEEFESWYENELQTERDLKNDL